MKVLCIGSAVVDIMAAPVSQQLKWKEKQRISSIRILVGGDAANQSIRFSDAGFKSYLLSGIGADENGKLLRNALESRGVNTSYLAEKKDMDTGTAIVLVDEKGERHTFSVEGAYTRLSAQDCSVIFDSHWDAISLASLFSMPHLEKEGLLELLKTARKKNIPVFADLSSDKLHQGLAGISDFLPYISWFLPSLYDAMEMTRTKNAMEAAEVYHRSGADGILIKCGSEGCYYSSKKEAQKGWVSAVLVQTVDTTGAGDCMAALFASRMLQGDSLKQAIQYACSGASLSTLYFGASAEKLTHKDICQFMEKHRLL